MNSRYSSSAHAHAEPTAVNTGDAAPVVAGALLGHDPEQPAAVAAVPAPPAPVGAGKSPSTGLPSTLAPRRLKAWLLNHPIPILLGTLMVGLISGRRLFRN